MPFIEVNIDNPDLALEHSVRQGLIREVRKAVAEQLSCVMPNGSVNKVSVTQLAVRVHIIDRHLGERQEKDVEVKIEAIGYPDRMVNRQERGDVIKAQLAEEYPNLTFGAWLDLKPDATWSD